MAAIDCTEATRAPDEVEYWAVVRPRVVGPDGTIRDEILSPMFATEGQANTACEVIEGEHPDAQILHVRINARTFKSTVDRERFIARLVHPSVARGLQ
jgi:hypothetical protein